MNSRRKPDTDPFSGIVCGATGLRGSWYFLRTSKAARTLAGDYRQMTPAITAGLRSARRRL